jgi:hypothetical protein
MDEWSRFTLAGHLFVAYLPSDVDEPQAFTVVVTRKGKEIRRESISLIHEPTFGPDVADIAVLDQLVEKIIAELGLK